MAFNVPMSRGVNSTFSPAGRVPNAGDVNMPGPARGMGVGWGGKGNQQAQATAPSGPGQGMGGGGSAPQPATNPDARATMLGTLTLPKPAGGGVMGPGRSYPRVGMGGGLDRLGVRREG